jgi:HEAT repeat protein
MREQNQPLKLALIAFCVLAVAAAAGVIGYWIIYRAHAPERALEAKFKMLQVSDGNPLIQNFREDGPDAVVFLARKMDSPKAATREKAVATLRTMGPAYSGQPAGFKALCAALNQSDDQERSIAEGALGDLGDQAKTAVPALINAVSDNTDINGIWALGRIGPAAADALPTLESIMRQPDGRARIYAAGAVLQIGGTNDEAQAVIQKASQDSSAQIRNDARNVTVELSIRD